jgi:hypothetical protein
MRQSVGSNKVLVQDLDEYDELEKKNEIEKDEDTTQRGTNDTDDDSWCLVVSRTTTRNLSGILLENTKLK